MTNNTIYITSDSNTTKNNLVPTLYSNIAPPMIVLTGTEQFIDNLCITSRNRLGNVLLHFQCTALVPDIIVLEQKYEHKSNDQLLNNVIAVWQQKENIKFLFDASVTKPIVDISRLRGDASTMIDVSNNTTYNNSGTYVIRITFEITEQDYVYYTLKYR